jgi:hypothetical protein
MKPFKLFVTIAIALLGNHAFAQGDASADFKPSFSASQSVTATARVEALNQETREVTLLLEDGSLFTSQVSDEARNLDQVSVGDIVYAHYTESISIRVVENDGAEPETVVQEELARTGEGKMPGVAATESAVTNQTARSVSTGRSTLKTCAGQTWVTRSSRP